MIRGIQAGALLVVGAVFVLLIARCPDPYARIDEARAARWSEYASLLERETGPLRHLGGVHAIYGGCDVYTTGDGTWWLVGPGRRWANCRPEDAAATSDRLVMEECRRLGHCPEDATDAP